MSKCSFIHLPSPSSNARQAAPCTFLWEADVVAKNPPTKEPGTCSALEGVSLGSRTFSCPEKRHQWASLICFGLSSKQHKEIKRGCWARGWCLSHLSHRGSEGSHRHSGVFAPGISCRFTHGQGLSAQGPLSTAHSQQCSVPTRRGCEGQSAKGRPSLGELEL